MLPILEEVELEEIEMSIAGAAVHSLDNASFIAPTNAANDEYDEIEIEEEDENEDDSGEEDNILIAKGVILRSLLPY